ncbi:cytochrome P450 4V2 [Caerostris extrusa]|uniref:Cytochrome P450 4V2 n=1 Tax=Caerostris extrusa TaxID=172846 RepID=A0AAV4XX48_CAEEX|nr:cytochrome P450 4V2 [Caerostris extrusa]
MSLVSLQFLEPKSTERSIIRPLKKYLFGTRHLLAGYVERKRIIEKSDFHEFFKPYVGNGIFTCDSSQWKARRKLLAAGFHSSMLKGYLVVINKHAQKLVEFLHEETGKESTCIESPLSLCSLDIVCVDSIFLDKPIIHPILLLESILGVKIGALQSEAEEYVSSLHGQALEHLRIAHGFSRKIIKERKLRYMKGETADGSRRPKCLLDVLLKLHIEDQVLDEEGVRQEVDTFIAAGHDTVAVAVKWALYLIGLYPEVQEKIHHELDSVLGADNKCPISIDDLKEFKYLDCVLKESNRLYPPSPAIARKVSEEISICGYKIPKRTTVVASIFFLHRDENVFPDPEKFDPERFLPENSTRIPECAYIPLAAGPRNCIGRVFGEMEVKVLVCHILRNFSLHSLDSRDKVLPIIKFTLQSSQPTRIKFRRRQQ